MTFPQRLPADVFTRIQRQVRDEVTDAGFDALVTDDPEDVAYLTGFFHHPCERPVAVWLGSDGGTYLLLPELERDHAVAQHTVADLVVYPEYPGRRPPHESLAATHGARAGRLAVPGSMTVGRLAALHDAFPGSEIMPGVEVVARARMRKQPEEIALHREAGRITDLMLTAGRDLVAGAIATAATLPSEAELASHVSAVGSAIMYAEHADVVVRSPLAGGLVYAGANSAQPHALPSAYRLRPGDSFMLSLGCAVGGRYVEGERTFVLGEPTAEQRHRYEAVEAAQRRGAEELRPGVSCAEVNRSCLDVIRAAGLGVHLRHRQGHGIGVGMHEPPWLEDGDDTELQEGMVVSNEPGIYITGEAGFRISDSMLLTEDGAEPFTVFPRSLDHVVIPA